MSIKHNFLISHSAVFAALFFFVSVSPLLAQPSVKLFRATSGVKMNTPYAANSTFVSVDHAALASALSTSRFVLQGIPLPQVAGLPQTVDLDLTEFSVITEKTKVTLQVGDKQIPGALPTVRTYRGIVKDDPNTLAFIAAQPDGNVSGFIRFDKKEKFSISVASRTDNYTSVITPMSALPDGLVQCGMDESKHAPNGITPRPLNSKSAPMQSKPKPLAATKTCVVAIDEDYACYQEFGNHVDYITARLAAITVVYEKEIGVAMTLGPFNVWTTPDPYSGGNSDAVLQSFTNYWKSNHQGDADQRTLAHLISRRLGGGGAQGIAWLDGMCNPQTTGYGFTNISGNNTGVDESVFAHELGHNVGSPHTHDCNAYPPNGIDRCVSGPGCTGPLDPSHKGSIMSYCNNKVFSFVDPTTGDSRVVDVLQAAVDAATCLETLAKITVNDTGVVFPKTAVGKSKDSVLKKIVTNNGTEAPLKITGVAIESQDAGSWKVKNPPTFPVTLATGQSMDLTLTFQPEYGAELESQLVFYHNATGGSSSVNLHGRGTAPVADYSIHVVDAFDFGPITDKSPHDSTLYYVQNLGDAPLTITSTKIKGAGATEFTIVSGGAPYIVQPGDTGSIVIRFQAKTNGFKSGFIYFTSNADDSTLESTVNLTADVSNLGVSSSSENEPQLIASPNPFSGKLQLELRAGSEYLGKTVSINIFDNLGRKVGSIEGGKFSASEKLFWQPDVSVAEGTYTVVAKLGTKEIVKQIVYTK